MRDQWRRSVSVRVALEANYVKRYEHTFVRCRTRRHDKIVSYVFKVVPQLTSLQTPLHTLFGGEQTHTSPCLMKLSSQDQWQGSSLVQ